MGNIENNDQKIKISELCFGDLFFYYMNISGGLHELSRKTGMPIRYINTLKNFNDPKGKYYVNVDRIHKVISNMNLGIGQKNHLLKKFAEFAFKRRKYASETIYNVTQKVIDRNKMARELRAKIIKSKNNERIQYA